MARSEDTAALIEALMELPGKIHTAKRLVNSRLETVEQLKERLRLTEAQILCAPEGAPLALTGRNKEARDAEVLLRTEEERLQLKTAEDTLRRDRAQLERWQDEFNSLRAVSRVIAAEGEVE